MRKCYTWKVPEGTTRTKQIKRKTIIEVKKKKKAQWMISELGISEW